MNENVFSEIESLLKKINLETEDKNILSLFLENKRKLIKRIREFEKSQEETIKTIEDLKKILGENDTFRNLKKRVFSLFEQYIFLKLEDVKNRLEKLTDENKENLLNEIIKLNKQLENILNISDKDFQKILYTYLRDKEGFEGKFLELIEKEKRKDYSKLKRGILFLRYLNIFKKSNEITPRNIKTFLNLIKNIKEASDFNIPSLDYTTIKTITRITEFYLKNRKKELLEKYNTEDGQIIFIEKVIFKQLNIKDINMGNFYSCLSQEFKKTMTNWNGMNMPFKHAKIINDLNPDNYSKYNTEDGQIRFVEEVIFEKLNIKDINMGHFYSCLSQKFKKTMTNWNKMDMPYKFAKFINNLNSKNYLDYNIEGGQIIFVEEVIFKQLNIKDINMGNFYSCLSQKFKKTMTKWNKMDMSYKIAEKYMSLYLHLKKHFSGLKYLKLLSRKLLKLYEENLEKIFSNLQNVNEDMINNLESEEVDKKCRNIFEILKKHKYKTDVLFKALSLDNKPENGRSLVDTISIEDEGITQVERESSITYLLKKYKKDKEIYNFLYSFFVKEELEGISDELANIIKERMDEEDLETLRELLKNT